MAATTPNRVERFTKWAYNHRVVSIVIIIFVACSSIRSFVEMSTEVYKASQNVWSMLTSKKLSSQKEVEEWARNVNEQKEAESKKKQTQELTPSAQRTNDEIRSTYSYFLSDLTSILKAYQKNNSANIYIQVPKLPENLFVSEASHYRAGAIFSSNAAWAIFFKDQVGLDKNRVLELHFMNGDGTTKGGSGVGLIQIFYNLENKTVDINYSGVGQIVGAEFEKKMSVEDFKNACPSLVKSLLQYQLKHL